MCAKTELLNYKNYLTEKKILLMELEYYKNDIDSIGTVNYSERVQTSGISDKTANNMFIKDKKLLEIERKINLIDFKINKIKTMLEVLSEDERTVINLLYFSESQLSTTSACMKVGMSRATFYRVKGKALKKLDRFLN
ncbi:MULTISPECIES: DUF1492 domain-containing protein [Clostridium]|uniref:Uncharacterized protein n=1 Tax=Clostridium tepidum TaxID=1962263 RepID=A0A1S9I247_9CLOT|nr:MULTISPECIES: DUF1492 domain-containing protein [Clostridium]KOY67282.1 hypothetical protein AN649_03755 [Clostridium sporogenes]MCW6106835.1 DUF1492 domain-containing protein [Clostridium sporogenes]OOO64396.1 hypothetical protein BS638_10920 [Clostridium tepidum]